MLLERLKVLKTDQRYMWLENKPQSACGSCQHGGSCGVSTLSKVFNFNRNNILKLQNHIKAKQDDWVEITIPDSVLLKSSFLVYLVPLLAMIVFAIVAKLLFQTELSSIVGAIMGLFLSALVIKNRTFNVVLQEIIKPKISKVIQKDIL